MAATVFTLCVVPPNHCGPQCGLGASYHIGFGQHLLRASERHPDADEGVIEHRLFSCRSDAKNQTQRNIRRKETRANRSFLVRYETFLLPQQAMDIPEDLLVIDSLLRDAGAQPLLDGKVLIAT